MQAIRLGFNDGWEGTWSEHADGILEYIDARLQPGHPMRKTQWYPASKLWRRHTYILEKKKHDGTFWLLDFHRRKRVQGKSFVYFKQIEDQAEMDEILRKGLEYWVQEMKDRGAWYG